MDRESCLSSYRLALYEGFLDPTISSVVDVEFLKRLKDNLDVSGAKFKTEEITFDELINLTSEFVGAQTSSPVLMGFNRDICIFGSMVLGAGLLAAWVASGGTLTIGALAAGVTVSGPLYAALIGGAGAATLACILGSCGDC